MSQPAAPLLNVDCGELPDESESLFVLADLVIVACGGHAGDAASMRLACDRAKAHGTRLGAHPSYPDRAGFGRVAMELTPAALRKALRVQCLHLLAAARTANVPVHHVKFHGALYHRVDADPAIASVACGTAVDLFGRVAFLGGAGGALEAECVKRGLPFLREGFADRGMGADGKLLPRSEPGAVLSDPSQAVARVESLRRSGAVDTICVHADSPAALSILKAVRASLDAPLPPVVSVPVAGPVMKAERAGPRKPAEKEGQASMKVLPYGTGAWLVEAIDPALPPAEVDARLRTLPGIRDVLVADGCALVEFGDEAPVDPRPVLSAPFRSVAGVPTEHVVVVRYDGADLDEVARVLGRSKEEVIRRHLSRTYDVQLVGFQPGFAYLGPLDPVLDVPRRAQPRTRVPACSVAIAPGRTAIYPHASPGGWNLIGHAEGFTPFDGGTGARFRLGDRVRFVSGT